MQLQPVAGTAPRMIGKYMSLKNGQLPKSSLTLITGNEAMTLAGMEQLFKALTGKEFTAQERVEAQHKIDAHYSTLGQDSSQQLEAVSASDTVVLTKGQIAAKKAIGTWKMANTLAKALGKRYSKRWQFVDFLGPNGRESSGIVDILAIRKSGKTPAIDGLKKLDLFEIMVIQVKGGSAPAPTHDEIARLRKVAAHYHATEIVLFQWKKGISVETGYKVLHESKNEWNSIAGEKLFGD